MLRQTNLIIVLLVVAFQFGCGLNSGKENDKALAPAGSRMASTPDVPVKKYYYNYPHAVTPDYAYRTERVFPPPGQKSFWQRLVSLARGMPGASEEEAILSNGEEFQRKIALLTRDLLLHTRENIADEYSVAVSTFVNLNNLYMTSAFGRLIGEQILGELHQTGIEVVDVRKTPGLMIKEEFGEYAMSRDMNELSFVLPAQAVVTGTYSQVDGQVFVNARLIRTDDGVVLATSSLVFEKNKVVERLLADEEMPAGYTGGSVQVRAF